MKKSIRVYLLLIVIALLLGFCINTFVTKKSFYQMGTGWGYAQFPLLEPYYAINSDDQIGWQISLHAKPPKTNIGFTAISNVTEIAVENGVILVYSAYDKPIQLLGGQKKELHWYVLIPDGIEAGFETEATFNLSLKQYDIEQPDWQEPFSLFRTYAWTGCLPWISNCVPPIARIILTFFFLLTLFLILYWVWRKFRAKT
jgi:hypothetical protein